MLKHFNFTKKQKKNKLDEKIRKTTTIDEKFDILISEIKAIKTDLRDFREEFNKYKKQDSDFQETSVNNFIMSLLDRNKNAYNVQLIPIKNVYVPNSSDALTELDGLILYTPVQPHMPRVSAELTNRVNKNFQESLKPNLAEIDNLFVDSQLIAVESKRSVSKQKIDAKLEQFFEMTEMLKRLTSIPMSSKEFQGFIERLVSYSRLTTKDLEQIQTKLIFGSDDISPAMRKYICAINKGILEKEYVSLCGEMFKEDKYAGDFIKTILQTMSVPKPHKELLKHYETFEELLSILSTHFREYDMGYIKPYLTPFLDLEHLFTFMKGRVGIVQFNKATFPELFQFATLNDI